MDCVCVRERERERDKERDRERVAQSEQLANTKIVNTSRLIRDSPGEKNTDKNDVKN